MYEVSPRFHLFGAYQWVPPLLEKQKNCYQNNFKSTKSISFTLLKNVVEKNNTFFIIFVSETMSLPNCSNLYYSFHYVKCEFFPLNQNFKNISKRRKKKPVQKIQIKFIMNYTCAPCKFTRDVATHIWVCCYPFNVAKKFLSKKLTR